MAQKDREDYQIITVNRKARHDYHILETYEAGLVLRGTEVKSIRNSQVSIKESYAQFKGEELFIVDMHIAPYKFGNRFNLEPKRDRKLLLNKRELGRIKGNIDTKGVTVIPLRLYFKNGYAKLEIALAKGKKLYDKRRDLTEKAIKRESERELKNKTWGR
ncbi:MAG: SsrA-binding protein SmpB [Candidatus Atribacteria bacterium]|nr:SsrA-binding protein SmpB [Candidatus Atribacteria bacterium]